MVRLDIATTDGFNMLTYLFNALLQQILACQRSYSLGAEWRSRFFSFPINIFLSSFQWKKNKGKKKTLCPHSSPFLLNYAFVRLHEKPRTVWVSNGVALPRRRPLLAAKRASCKTIPLYWHPWHFLIFCSSFYSILFRDFELLSLFLLERLFSDVCVRPAFLAKNRGKSSFFVSAVLVSIVRWAIFFFLTTFPLCCVERKSGSYCFFTFSNISKGRTLQAIFVLLGRSFRSSMWWNQRWEDAAPSCMYMYLIHATTYGGIFKTAE